MAHLVRHYDFMNQNDSEVNQDREGCSGFFAYPADRPNLPPKKPSESVRLSNEDDEDLSGCLASQGFGFNKSVGQKQPVKTNKYRDEDLSGCLSGALTPKKAATNYRDEDLSGCLSGALTPKKVTTNYRDEDLSGCLSGALTPKKIQPKISHRDRFKPIERDDISGEIKPINNDDEGSGWLYLN